MISQKYNEQMGNYLAKLAQTKTKLLTNADRIRAMSDEELAEFIATQRYAVINPIADKLNIDTASEFAECKKVMLDFLKQEVDA